MKHNIDIENNHVNCQWGGASGSTFGGEYYDGDDYHDEYGLAFDNLTISGIPSKDFENLAIEMLNHLFANGHDYTIDKYQNGYFIRRLNLNLIVNTKPQYGYENQR